MRLLPVLLLMLSSAASAEVYIYTGPNGERMVTDKPVKDQNYRLLTQRDSFSNVGRILANRPIKKAGPEQFQRYITNASREFNLDPALLEAVIKVESDFNPSARSSAGAAGLMQLMQATATQYNVSDRYNPRENIQAGAKHLSYLLERFNGNLMLALAAYNAGPSTVEKYSGIPPYPETRRYIRKVLDAHSSFQQMRYGAE